MAEPVAERRLTCYHCGTELVATATQAVVVCHACGASYDAAGGRFQPDCVVPFVVSEPQARAAVLRWIRSAWLTPVKLPWLARKDTVKGVYVPFWIFDAHAIAHWDRAGGVRGIVEMDFGDLLVCADRNVDPKLVDRLGPYSAKSLRPYDARQVAGWMVLRGQRGIDEAAGLAHSRMERELLGTATRGQPEKFRDKIHLRGVEYARESWRQALLPMWVLEYTYLMRAYRIAVNGATGVTAGTSPPSVVKIALLIVAALSIYVLLQDPESALRVPLAIGNDIGSLVMRSLGNR